MLSPPPPNSTSISLAWRETQTGLGRHGGPLRQSCGVLQVCVLRQVPQQWPEGTVGPGQAGSGSRSPASLASSLFQQPVFLSHVSFAPTS